MLPQDLFRYIKAAFVSLCIGGDEFCVIMRKDLDKVSLMMNTKSMRKAL